MSLSLEESIFLERLRKARPDIIEELKKQNYVEWKTKNKAKALAGIASTPKHHSAKNKKTDIVKAVATKAKRMAAIT